MSASQPAFTLSKLKAQLSEVLSNKGVQSDFLIGAKADNMLAQMRAEIERRKNLNARLLNTARPDDPTTQFGAYDNIHPVPVNWFSDANSSAPDVQGITDGMNSLQVAFGGDPPTTLPQDFYGMLQQYRYK